MAKRNYQGTNGDDLISGGKKTDDKILGEKGNDVLIGQGGNDLLNGGLGNDVLVGGPGNDVLIGGTGNDVLIAQNGNDDLDGGIGNDKFLVNGKSGDRVFIVDTDGKNDELNVSGADNGADINLRPGSTSTVDGRKEGSRDPARPRSDAGSFGLVQR